MFANLYFVIIIIIIKTYISSCTCYVNYDIFKGFDFSPVETTANNGENVANVVTSAMSTEPWTGEPTTPHPQTTTPTNITTTTPIPTIPYPKFLCPEDEKPFNIGAYEVPTQRDVALLVQKTLLKMFHTYQRRAMGLLHDIQEVPTQRDVALLVQKTLLKMFHTYQRQAMGLLHDIQEATKATADIEKNCFSHIHYHQNLYKQCVKRISNKCQFITKTIVIEMEKHRASVSAFIDGTICTVKDMKADPLQVIKKLAIELAALKFALPGFLRLLGSCSTLCEDRRLLQQTSNKKPIRHMTDQDLVIKHFLTKKSYIELIKGSK